MKKLLLTLTFILVTMGAFAKNIGVVNVQALMHNHPKAQSVAQELTAKKESLEREINKRGEAYLAMRQALVEKGEAASEDEKLALAREERALQAYISQLQNELDRFEQSKTNSLQVEIMTAIKEIKDIKNLDMVLDGSIVILGGIDITKDVSDFLSNIEKISLD